MIGGGVMKRKIIFQALDWRLKDIKNNLCLSIIHHLIKVKKVIVIKLMLQ